MLQLNTFNGSSTRSDLELPSTWLTPGSALHRVDGYAPNWGTTGEINPQLDRQVGRLLTTSANYSTYNGRWQDQLYPQSQAVDPKQQQDEIPLSEEYEAPTPASPSIQSPQFDGPSNKRKSDMSRAREKAVRGQQKSYMRVFPRVNKKSLRRPPIPRTFCTMPGCTKSVAREADIRRHLKTQHGGQKYRCYLCLNEAEKVGGSKQADHLYGVKYNLME